jgi:SAM-dependent methyltransferase
MSNTLYNSSAHFTKSISIENVFGFSLIIVTIYCMSTIFQKNIETMESDSSPQFIIKRGDNIYDDFYVDIYDTLFFYKPKHDYELSLIFEKTSPTRNSKILDIGSGTGHHVGDINKAGYNVKGIDISRSMIKKAMQNYPNSDFVQGDVLKSITFPSNSFTHIICMNFTIYVINDMDLLFNNCMNWLTSDGYLIVHIADPTMFNPILNISESTYSDGPKIISHSTINDYKCETTFNIIENNATFTETFKNVHNDDVRKNFHEITMPTPENMKIKADAHGFIFKSRSKLHTVGYEGQYIYFFKKSA